MALEDVVAYIHKQIAKYDDYPIGIQITEVFDRDIKGFVKTVSISFHKLRGADVKRARGNEVRGK